MEERVKTRRFILLIIIGASFCGGFGGYGGGCAPIAPAYRYGIPNAPANGAFS